MPYCQNCGTQHPETAVFCPGCGNRVNGQTLPAVTERIIPEPRNMDAGMKRTLDTLISKMKTSSGIWTGIGIYQLVVGVFTLMLGYGVLSIFLGIWNIVQSSKQKKTRLSFAQNPVGIVSYFEKNKTATIIFVFLNLFFGAFLGIIGSIYDLIINHYALNNKESFHAIERWAENRPNVVGLPIAYQQ